MASGAAPCAVGRPCRSSLVSPEHQGAGQLIRDRRGTEERLDDKPGPDNEVLSDCRLAAGECTAQITKHRVHAALTSLLPGSRYCWPLCHIPAYPCPNRASGDAETPVHLRVPSSTKGHVPLVFKKQKIPIKYHKEFIGQWIKCMGFFTAAMIINEFYGPS